MAFLRTPKLGAWLGVALVVLLVAGAIYFVWQQPGDAQPAAKKGGRDGGGRPTPVVAVPAKVGNVNVYLAGLGTVVPLRTVTVRSRVDGQLMDVLFKEGQIAKQGDLLAQIDPRPYQAQVTQYEGQMVRDQALLANARIDLDRYRTLLAQDSIPKQQLDTQEALVRQYEGVVKLDQGLLDNAKLQLVYARITAPVSGRLGLRQVDPGNIVRASDQTGMVVITQLQPITVLFTIPQDNLPLVLKRIKSGERIPVDAYDREQKNRLASGQLVSIDNQIDTTTGTVRLKAEFTNEDNALFPNQFVNARMLVDTRRDVTTVPSAAIQRGMQGIFVYVVKDDRTVALRPLKAGPVEGDVTVVESGVQPGDVVVVDGADRLREGAKVELPGSSPPAEKGDVPRKKGGGSRKKGGDAAAEKAGG
jgi:multidrug efflux system membrane fusion protein